MNDSISVIIPALNEETNILPTLKSLRNLPGITEIIVADGGSTDNTVALASPLAKVINSPRGRATQMNAGAREAGGDILLFLHADSRLPADGIKLVHQALQPPGVVGGGFRVKFDDNSFIFKLIALGSNLRAMFTKIFFGDQGIFVRRDTYLEIGGFPDIPIMEEWGFCQKLKTKGRLVQLPAAVLTSSRRWHKHGVWKTILLMHKLKILYLLGVSPAKLQQIYPSHSEPKQPPGP